MRTKITLLAIAAVPAAALSFGALTMNADASTSTAAQPSTVTTAASTCRADYSPIPSHWSTEKGGLDIGRLTKVTSKHGVVTIRIDRVSFFTGAEAKALNGGVTPNDDYIETNVDAKQRSFTVDPKSSIRGSLSLTSHPQTVGTQKLTLAQFVHNANRSGNISDPPLVWLRHTHGMSGTVTAISEQFVP